MIGDERSQIAVCTGVSVRGRQRNIAQRGRAKRIAVRLFARYPKSPVVAVVRFKCGRFPRSDLRRRHRVKALIRQQRP